MIQPLLGDVLERDKGLLTHVGIYMGNGLVLHASPELGVAITTVTDFAKNQMVRLRRVPDMLRHEILSRAQAVWRRGGRYDLINNNCQHVVNEVVHGTRISPAVWIALLVVLAVVVGGAVAAMSKK